MKYFSEADIINMYERGFRIDTIVEIVKSNDSVRVARECVERVIYDYLMERKNLEVS